MKIAVKSPITGKDNVLDLPVTAEQIAKWQAGMLIQDAMPNLTPDQREFLISGCAPGEYDDLFKEKE